MKMSAFMAGPLWDRNTALAMQKEDALGTGFRDWNYPERWALLTFTQGLAACNWHSQSFRQASHAECMPCRSAGMLQHQHVPDGFWSANVFPYDPELNVILPVSEVQHIRNGNTIRNNIWAVFKMEDVLVK